MSTFNVAESGVRAAKAHEVRREAQHWEEEEGEKEEEEA